MVLPPGTQLGSYEVLSLLGAGGMGEVYRARDMRLGRDVAIKVLPADVARDADRLNRFRREAKSLAAIDHPNIVTVFSVEEAQATGHDTVHFLTMQLVPGQPLDRLIPDRGLPLERILEIAAAIADALAAAHDKHIVHRDLKPANVMVAVDGRVRVLDFGLAKDLTASGQADATVTSAGRTEHGVVMGTPAYMSPEQIAGRAIDHRSDIFSLGILLYQMASGERPFAGATSIELASAILRDTPPLITDLRDDLPADLARLIRRCLEKDPAQRIQTARDVANDCRDLSQQILRRPPTPARRSRPEVEGFWIAVLPFKYGGANTELTALTEGLAEEIVTGLSRFSYLRVISRGSSDALRARYVVEGSLRQAGSQLRIAVQLVDTTTGAHLWAESFNRAYRPEDVFGLQDELVARIVSTVADQHGVLVHSMSAVIRGRSDAELSPHEAALCVFGFHERMTPDEHARVRAILERAVRQAPDDSDCWAMLATVYTDEYMFGFNVLPDPLGRAQPAARRALELSPSSALASQALAQNLFFRKELDACRRAAERTIALNPMDSATNSFMGLLLALSGDWDRGCAVADAAMKLNPHFPGWYWLTPLFNAMHEADYRAALGYAGRIAIPGYFWVSASAAAAAGHLGELETARKALRELLTIRPDFAATARDELSKWFQPELVETFLGGLQKAGLEPAGRRAPDSGVADADESFRVAVLPFKYSGASADLMALAEGLSEEIITGLSRFSYLRVIARGSSTRGARYVMEGSLRQAGSQLRLAVQLVDATTGAHLWAETYNRALQPDATFDLQDDLVPRIVSTVADWYGVLPRSMSDAIRHKPVDQLSPYEAVLRSFGYSERRTAEEHRLGRQGLERAVQHADGCADAWALLSILHSEEHATGFNAQPDPLGRALDAARRAIDADPANALGHFALARARFFRKEFQACQTSAEQALSLNPMDGGTVAFIGVLLAYSGDWDRGCSLVERAATLNPRHPGWYWFPLFLNAYRKRDYAGALDIALKLNLPNFYFSHVMMAAVQGQCGDRGAAGEAIRELLALRPDFDRTGRSDLEKWYPPDLVAHLLDGLQKAGLGVASAGDPIHETSSIAVLPFTNMSADKDQDYFGDGLAEEILNLLSAVPGLKVIARTSAFAFKGRNEDVRQIAQALGVRSVLEGSVRRAGDRVRVTAQLVAAADGAHLWSERFDRPLTDVFAMQDEMATAIATALQRRLGHARARPAVANLAAYELVLQGRGQLARFTPDSWNRARACFERAVDLDANYAAPHAGLALGHFISGMHGMEPMRDVAETVRAEAGRALSLDPDDPQPRFLLGAVALAHDYDWPAASAHFAASMATPPVPGHARWIYASLYLQALGRHEDAAAEMARAVETDPLNATFLSIWSAHLGYLKRFDQAIDAARRAVEIEPHDFLPYHILGEALAEVGRHDEALAALERAHAMAPWFAITNGWLAAELRRAGQDARADAILQAAGPVPRPLFGMVIYHVRTGNIDAAADWYDRMIDERDPFALVYARAPLCEQLQAHPRWPGLAARMNLPPKSPEH